MYKKDERLIGFHDIINAQHAAKYQRIIGANPFTRLPELLDWLEKHIPNELPGKKLPELSIDAISDLLVSGDSYYETLFKAHNLLPQTDDEDEKLPHGALTYATRRISHLFTGHRDTNGGVPLAYSELQDAIERLLGEKFAVGKRFTTFKSWKFLSELLWTSRTFFWGLADALPLDLLRAQQSELSPDIDQNNVVAYLSQGDRRMDDQAYHRQHITKREELQAATPYTYIDELTCDADTMSLSEDQEFKLALIGRLGPEAVLHWLDQLYWPLAQAAALNGFEDLSDLESLIELLVQKRNVLTTPFPHLLLIMLDRYLKLVKRISFNLKDLAGNHHHYNTDAAGIIETEGQLQLKAWKENGMKGCIDRLYHLLTDQIATPDKTIHQALFGWVAAQDKEMWLQHNSGELMLPILEHLQLGYLDIYRSERWDKNSLFTAVSGEGLTWKNYKVLYELWEADPTMAQRKILTDQMTAFLLNAKFSWNSSYHFKDHYLHQALHFTRLCFIGPDSIRQLTELTQKNRPWHEGWAYRGLSAMAHTNRYIFLLTCRIWQTYLYYEQGDTANAGAIWQPLDLELVQQYRSTVSDLDRQHYLLPMRLLTHTLLRFNPAAITNYLQQKCIQLDRIEDLLMLAETIMDSSTGLNVSIAASLRKHIWQVIDDGFWVISTRLQHAKHPEHLHQYQKLYDKCKPWFA